MSAAVMPAAAPRILVICSDRVGARMAGPGIRSVELARALRSSGEVTVAAVDSAGAEVGLRLVSYDLRDPVALRAPIMDADVVFAQPQWPHITRWLVRSGARLIYDLYTPEPLEVLERRPPLRPLVTALTEDRMAEALHTGHHFVCASEKQRDLWTGTMLGERLLRPAAYDRDPSLRSLVATVPFGVPSEPPRADGRPIRARFAAIGGDDEVVLWNGGLWNWFDAPTAIRAVAQLAARRERVKLVFMGASAIGAAERATAEARRTAEELGVLDSVVFFNDAWVPYEERAGWLLEADAAVSTHVEHLETRFAFRTRLLDCFWSGLPVVCTRGDDLAERIERDDLGAVAPQGDAAAVAAGLGAVLERGRAAFAPQLAQAAEEHAWARVAEPLRAFIAAPEPPRLGRGVPRRPGHAVRNVGFQAALVALRTLNLRWPRL